MVGKLNRDEVLRGLLQTLVEGWGYNSVITELHKFELPLNNKQSKLVTLETAEEAGAAVRLVEQIDIPPERKRLLLDLALRFDEGSAFPTLSDVRTFLLLHHHNGRELKGRSQAFRRMLPILSGMSEKGLEKVLSRSFNSGPAELEAISNAIREAGEDLRGEHRTQKSSTPHEIRDADKGLLPPNK